MIAAEKKKPKKGKVSKPAVGKKRVRKPATKRRSKCGIPRIRKGNNPMAGLSVHQGPDGTWDIVESTIEDKTGEMSHMVVSPGHISEGAAEQAVRKLIEIEQAQDAAPQNQLAAFIMK